MVWILQEFMDLHGRVQIAQVQVSLDEKLIKSNWHQLYQRFQQIHGFGIFHSMKTYNCYGKSKFILLPYNGQRYKGPYNFHIMDFQIFFPSKIVELIETRSRMSLHSIYLWNRLVRDSQKDSTKL